jgi:hypothetical protein
VWCRSRRLARRRILTVEAMSVERERARALVERPGPRIRHRGTLHEDMQQGAERLKANALGHGDEEPAGGGASIRGRRGPRPRVLRHHRGWVDVSRCRMLDVVHAARCREEQRAAVARRGELISRPEGMYERGR